MRAGGGHGNAVDAVFLEEYRTAQIIHRARPNPVGADRRPPRICRKPKILVPVLEVAQRAAVKLVYVLLPVVPVAAAPQPVAALADEVHVRRGAADGDTAVFIGKGVCRFPRDDDEVALSVLISAFGGMAAEGVYYLRAVKASVRRAGYLHAVILRKRRRDLPLRREAQLRVHALHRRPHPRRGAVAAERFCSGVYPVIPVVRRLRRGGALVRRRVLRAVYIAHAAAHAPLIAPLRVHAAVLRAIGRVVIEPVGENADVRAHAHKLLSSGAYARQGRGRAVIVKRPRVYIGQRVLFQQPLRRGEGGVHAPPAPHRQQRVQLTAQVFRAVQRALARFQAALIAPEGADGLYVHAFLFQSRIKHPRPSPLSNIFSFRRAACACGCSNLQRPSMPPRTWRLNC